jgi:hypothetical protein
MKKRQKSDPAHDKLRAIDIVQYCCDNSAKNKDMRELGAVIFMCCHVDTLVTNAQWNGLTDPLACNTSFMKMRHGRIPSMTVITLHLLLISLMPVSRQSASLFILSANASADTW